MKTLNEYIGENYEILDDLCKRLQDDYDGNTPFEQKEEDRLVMCNVLELYDHFKEQYTTCGYCDNKVPYNESGLLCSECRESFGHSTIHEL